MQKFPITRANPPDIAPRAAAFEASAKHEELQLEPPELGGVLKELAIARWRGLLAKSGGTPR
jgi:hypothetical protein